ncbi:MAG: CDP-alcohol phosphatidyltransferase family protein [Patescibacteria group bacterium]
MAEFFDNAAKKPLLLYVPRWIHPNHLSIARALLAVPIILLKDQPALCVALLTLSSVFDLLDGPLARIRNQRSALGAWFDSMSDKAFVISVIYLRCFDLILLPICIVITSLEASLVIVRILKERSKVKTDSNQFGALKTWSQSFALGFVLSGIALLQPLSSVVFCVAIFFATLSLIFHIRDFPRRS